MGFFCRFCPVDGPDLHLLALQIGVGSLVLDRLRCLIRTALLTVGLHGRTNPTFGALGSLILLLIDLLLALELVEVAIRAAHLVTMGGVARRNPTRLILALTLDVLQRRRVIINIV